MSSGQWLSVLRGAIDGMGFFSDSLGPRPLRPALADAFRARGIDASEEDGQRLSDALLDEHPNDPLWLRWNEALRQWDHLESADWTSDTGPHSRERRDLIYRLLSMPSDWIGRCEQIHAPRLADFSAVPVIGAPWAHWYVPQRRENRTFFWGAYKRYLSETRRWPIASVQDLDRDSTAIVERLADPESVAAIAVRGLVVGYVQSGKTANFTAVIAKAADAGYRLVIVLAGTLDVLRNQTQRRVDKELLGKELLEVRPNEDGLHDYSGDREWSDFVSHGGLPGQVGGFDWQRLTTAKFDYRSLKAGIAALEFKVAVPGRPYNDPENLHRDAARLLVVKKAPAILRKVIKDLKRLKVALATVPTLIIDDESDLASVNTMPPRLPDGTEGRRTATNSSIVELLGLLPRSSYIGYTATAAATVLMNERDDLFPRDFIIPLPKPTGYMGVAEFIDRDDCPESARYRAEAYVRPVVGDDLIEANLPKAIDSFVLAGCIKLHREQTHDIRFPHHTMLVHRSHHLKEHSKDREVVAELMDYGRFLSPKGIGRLTLLLGSDYRRVLQRLTQEGPVPPTLTLPTEADLPGLIEMFFNRLHRDRVLVANGDPKNEALAPDFDSEEVWAILVGGTKLSRGYTVEGLTTSYYRRRTASADTLMQMGRWFGYRRNYEDLVRVFLGREQDGHGGLVDLYDEFRACCIDEEEFRSQLAQYAADQERPLRPQDVPPLVYSSGLLPPTSRNKMHFAKRAVVNLGGEHKERTLAPVDVAHIEKNWAAFEGLARQMNLRELQLRLVEPDVTTRALCGTASKTAVLEFLRSYVWSRKGAYLDVIDFLMGSKGDPEIDDWCVMIPQLTRGRSKLRARLGNVDLDVHHRSRIGQDKHRYKVFSDPGHVQLAAWIAGVATGKASAELRPLHAPRRAVLVAYPCKEDNTPPANLGFFTYFPKNHLDWKVAFVTNQGTD